MFACSPNRSDEYMNAGTAEQICSLLRSKGFESLHIGGGEPFMNFEKLLEVIEAVQKSGLLIEYVETNGFWMSDEDRAKQYLSALRALKVERLLISLDAFHAEYIPVDMPLRLAETCKQYGIEPIVWQRQFESMFNGFEQGKTHARNELEELISPGYVLETARAYGLQFNGRAINIENEYLPCKPLAEIVAHSEPCNNLKRTDMMHVDLYGNYLVSWCAVIAIPLAGAVNGIPKGKYPILETLLSDGVVGLLEYAKNKGFEPAKEYTSSCALCFHIRHWLAESGNYPELYVEYFREALSHY